MAEDQSDKRPGGGNPSVAEVIGGGILRAVFQPIVDLDTDRPIGWEALARVGEGGGFDAWMRSADEVGLATELQFSALRAIGAHGGPPDGTILFVNVGAELIGDPRFLEECERLGPRVAIDVRSSDIERLEDMGRQLDEITTAGIHLSVDDTTAASLSMIARVRPSFIKLDAGVVRDVIQDPVPRAVVRAYVAFAEHEDIHIIAEGVERTDQVEVLRDLGVRFAQGYLFGRPTESWARPQRQRQRPPLDVDGTKEIRSRFDTANDLASVAEVACAELRAHGVFPAFYLEREGVLRCIAQLGLWQVVDGIPVHAGVMAQAFRSGRPQLVSFADADPADYIASVAGMAAELAVPIRVGRRTIGVLNVESVGELSASLIDEVHVVALAMEQRLEEVGFELDDSPLHRLARANTELAGLTDVRLIEMAATRMACEISGLSSGLLAMPGDRQTLVVKALQGPLGPELGTLPPEVLVELAMDLELVSSCMSSGDGDGLAKPSMTILRNSGASSIAAFPVRSTEMGDGLLFLADHAPVSLALDERESLELLAREVGRSLDMAVVMADLRTRATSDTLTGLGNLAAFQEALSAIGGRRRGRWAVAMADVDGLKQVNDTHGHLAGDDVLRELAASIDNVLRAEDRMYRIGGDEFAAILHDVDADGAAEVGERMCEAAGLVMGRFGAGLSVGIALPSPYEATADFLDRADKVLYEVKREAPGTARVAATGPGRRGARGGDG